MGRQIEVLEVIGMKKFREICFKHRLNSEETKVLKMVLRGYENMDKTIFNENDKAKDSAERNKSKEKVFQHAVEGLTIDRRKKICPPLAVILLLELEILRQERSKVTC